MALPIVGLLESSLNTEHVQRQINYISTNSVIWCRMVRA